MNALTQRNIMVSALRMVIVMTILTGFVYTLVMTLFANTVFYSESTGSILQVNGKAVGSELLAQQFTEARYFHERPSAAGYSTVPSGASNLGPASKALEEVVQQRRDTLTRLYGTSAIPTDLLFASGSGLDPHMSPEAARLQIHRVATARNLTPEQTQMLAQLVERHVEQPQLGILGQPRVNVLQLNLALDAM